jgi:hypothetical protein
VQADEGDCCKRRIDALGSAIANQHGGRERSNLIKKNEIIEKTLRGMGGIPQSLETAR